MANNITTKKTNFLNNTVNAFQMLYTARQQLKALQEEYANAFASNQATPITDADCLVSGSTQHLTAAIIAQGYSAVQGPVETAIAANLQSLLPILLS